VGGNDLKQFFFAADRENERVRRRYDTLDTGFLRFLQALARAARAAGHAAELLRRGRGAARRGGGLAALGFNMLSMRPASIGPSST
jgi:phosphotransferase system enzyme I (PtsP)